MKKYISYILLLFTCCISSNIVNAQSGPGLVGKRLTVSYDFNPFFNLGSFYSSGSYDQSTLEALFTYKNIVGIEYAISKTFSIGLDFGTEKHHLDEHENEILDQEYQHHLFTREYGLRVKYFLTQKAGSIAPIGPYLQFRVMQFWYKNEMSLEDPSEANFFLPAKYTYNEESILAGSFAFGHQSVLFGNIIYNIGCEMALVLAPVNYEIDYDTRILTEDIRMVMLYANMFKFKFGVAVPIF